MIYSISTNIEIKRGNEWNFLRKIFIYEKQKSLHFVHTMPRSIASSQWFISHFYNFMIVYYLFYSKFFIQVSISPTIKKLKFMFIHGRRPYEIISELQYILWW